jgi:pimeloyl-ACP methyl ester carboxylesterase
MTTVTTSDDGPRRGPLLAWAETRGFVGGHTVPHRTVHLSSPDGPGLRADLLPGPHDARRADGGRGPAVVLVHGFAAHARKPAYARLASQLAERLTVLAPDLRGHGRSAGTSGLGGPEGEDVGAALEMLRRRGHRFVAVVGVSMGGTASANAVAGGLRPDALVLVSAPAHVDPVPQTAPLQRLHRLWSRAAGRAGLRLVLGVRVVPPARWRPPVDPADAVAGWDGPLLVVHGDDDAYFPVWHATTLVRRAAGSSTLWLEPGFGHAEDGFHGDIGHRLAAALAGLAASTTDEQDPAWPT